MIDKLAWICIENNKLLLARSKNKNSYYIPGGKRDPDESDEIALIREVHEELSVDLIAGTLEYLHTFTAQADGKPEGTHVKMTCYFAEYEGQIMPAAEIEEVVWTNSYDSINCSTVTKIIIDWLKSQNYLN